MRGGGVNFEGKLLPAKCMSTRLPYACGMRIIALEEHFTTLDLHRAAKDHPTVKMQDTIAEFFGLRPEAGLVFPTGIDDVGEGRIAVMDQAGIDVQVLSQTVPGPQVLDPQLGVRLAAESNNAIAGAVEAHPERFRGFATLPVQAPQAAVAELERAITELGFVGAMVNGHVNGEHLDNQKYWPIFAKAEELGVPVYLHPARPPQAVVDAQYSGFSPVVDTLFAGPGIGWHLETAVHALRLVLAGVFDQFPDLQLILGHHGETLPSMIDRADSVLSGFAKLKTPIKEVYLRNFHLTLSGHNWRPPFLAAHHSIGADRILFSSDHPYGNAAATVDFFDDLPINSGEKEKIAHANAEKLLKIQ